MIATDLVKENRHENPPPQGGEVAEQKVCKLLKSHMVGVSNDKRQIICSVIETKPIKDSLSYDEQIALLLKIAEFKKPTYNSKEPDSLRDTSNVSNTNQAIHQPYPCEFSKNKLSDVLREIIQERFEQAATLSNKLPESLEKTTLQYVFTELHNAKTRKMSAEGNVSIKTSRKNSLPANFDLNLKSLSVSDQTSKIELIGEFVNQLCIRGSEDDIDYYKLIFAYIGRSDQRQSKLSHSLRLYDLLLQLKGLKLCDRINFASRILSNDRRKKWISQMERLALEQDNLENMLFVAHSPKDVIRIAQNFIDSMGDLQEVVSYWPALPALRPYAQIYREALLIGFELEKVDNLDYSTLKRGFTHLSLKGNTKSNPSARENVPPPAREANLFQRHLGEQTTGVGQSGPHYLCEICHASFKKGQTTAKCVRCGHGGHVTHLIKWFNRVKHCPNPECSCICS